MKILIINGPNLNLLGKREVDIYGNKSFDDFFTELKSEFKEVELTYFQSNHEGELIEKIHEVGFDIDGIVMNPAGYSHTSVALADAVAAVPAPVVEIHISNIFNREPYRVHSYISPVSAGVLTGFGLTGYKLAIKSLIDSK
ncbi:MAG: type II 3-dehydroquinate dehydratase [Cyclobacteriaceae bacterium]|nr:type II 3-dehydroquinate dehydratase [Cyclobacteriaceae bacterium HetDA_MAG_MS6]